MKQKLIYNIAERAALPPFLSSKAFASKNQIINFLSVKAYPVLGNQGHCDYDALSVSTSTFSPSFASSRPPVEQDHCCACGRAFRRPGDGSKLLPGNGDDEPQRPPRKGRGCTRSGYLGGWDGSRMRRKKVFDLRSVV